MGIEEGTVGIEFDVRVPTRDAVSLATDIYRPPGGGRLPAILLRSPYSNKNPALIFLARSIAARGFVTLVQNMRGRFGSGGVFTPFLNEREDGYDTLVWLARQEWFSGRLGLLGWSYSSHANYLIMGQEPPAGVKIVSAVSALEATFPYKAFNRGGALFYHWALPWSFIAKGNSQQWLKKSYEVGDRRLTWPDIFRLLPLDAIPEKMGIPLPLWETWISHRDYDDYWAGISLEEEMGRIETPILHLTGWYDFCAGQTIEAFQLLNRRLGNQALLIGPWDHENVFSAMLRNLLPQKKTKERSYGNDSDFDLFGAIVEWFAGWERGEPPLTGQRRVRVFVRGGDYWRESEVWPLEGTRWAEFYLDAAGALTAEKPARAGRDQFSYDPADPVPTLGGAISRQEGDLRPGPLDQRPVEARADVLTYSSPPLDEDFEVTGAVTAVLFASSSAADTDFTVKLVDAHPDGTAEILQDGIIRARFREGTGDGLPLEPGKVYRFEVELGATANLFRAGHRVRVEVSSSNFPKFDRNLNTLDERGNGSEFRVAEQTVYRGGDAASFIRLPVVEARARHLAREEEA